MLKITYTKDQRLQMQRTISTLAWVQQSDDFLSEIIFCTLHKFSAHYSHKDVRYKISQITTTSLKQSVEF